MVGIECMISQLLLLAETAAEKPKKRQRSEHSRHANRERCKKYYFSNRDSEALRKKIWYQRNRSALVAKQMRYNAANRGKIRAAYKKKWEKDEDFRRRSRDRLRAWKYGLTSSQIEQMLLGQDRKCAICERPISRNAHMDHCHKCKANRSLLCGNCNRGLGMFAEDPLRISRALGYLDKHFTDSPDCSE